MNIFEPKNHWVQIAAELRNFRRGTYPGFVTGDKNGGLENIPVFSFHDVEPEKFMAQLIYLADNGYQTVTADEYLAMEGKSPTGRHVMLTFDDGRASLWNVAYPALMTRRMKAVAFILPGEIKEAKEPRKPTNSLSDTGGEPLATWPEITAMRDSLDFQSHSLYHFMVFVSDRVECFYSPQIRDRWIYIDLPVLREEDGDDYSRKYGLGAPFYSMESRLSDCLRSFEPPQVRHALEKHVADNGGSAFFNRSGWERELTTIHSEAVKGYKFQLETPEERDESIRHNLSRSKRDIEERLPGHRVDHLCFPFGVGGAAAARIAAHEGFKGLYWGTTLPAHATGMKGVLNVTRMKDDYIFRLPGKGRWPLWKVMGAKALRRAGLASW
ncbi:MAG: polysaccharide deacetylase family protein [Nitrospinae bacterium]|nr:polysaccharide deacetylase family protein [Nitrospinota bacterium]